ncbi:MAG TPA: hypothetical protein DCZ94_17930 [Lentisphaeria bacterium]|nr:MAG: hypothetical protein A2X48_20705 [Lentisphaerae bacterium GWF2_49_21]HBC88826.1 hypothetical protein [Lentisphaeria bacterium]
MKFSSLTSEDPEYPDVTNIQLELWRLAVVKYEEIKDHSEEVVLKKSDFIVLASVTLILAGSSLTQLVGQNAIFAGSRVPSPADELEKQLRKTSPDLCDRIKEFIFFYDDIRHFGKPKHTKVEALNEKLLAQFMKDIQEVWIFYLNKANLPITEDFKHSFKQSE